MIAEFFWEIFFAVGFVCIGFTAGCRFGYSSGHNAKFEEEQLRLKRDAEHERKLKAIVDYMFGGDEQWNSKTKTENTTKTKETTASGI